MADDHDSTRRMLLTALAGITLANVTLSPAIASSGNAKNNSQILVAYFSRSGNTRVIAGIIQRQYQTDLFEIIPANPYPEDYFMTVEQAKNERDKGINPSLKNSVSNIEHYQIVYLGFPVWGTTVPPIVRTFLSTHNLAGKTLVPFITHGGYGAGNSAEILAQLAPQAKREEALIMECDQERKTTESVTQWLASLHS